MNDKDNRQTDIAAAVETLRKGGLILYPTDTVWGIGCDATRPDAVARVYELKRRSDSKALITLMPDTDMIERCIDSPEDVALDLVRLSVSPLTVIFDNAVSPIAHNLMAPDGSLAIRIPAGSQFCMELCRAFRKPIVSTSANISGQASPATFAEISEEILKGVDYVCTTFRTDDTPHKPSSIIRIHNGGRFDIIR